MTNSSPRAQAEGGDATPDSADQPRPRARLTRIKINRFRRVESGTELRFDDGINALLGRNGTGKTTLLELVVALARGDLRTYQRESFDLEFDILLEGETISISIKSETAQQKNPAALLSSGENATWSYNIRYSCRDGNIYSIEATKSKTLLKNPTTHEDARERALPEAPLFTPGFYENCICLALGLEAADFSGFRHQSVQLFNNLLRLDEGLDIFKTTTGGHPLPERARPLDARLYSGFPWGNPEESARSLLKMLTSYVPHSLIARLSELGESAHNATEVHISSNEWHLLGSIQRLLDAKNLQLTLQLIKREELETTGLRSSFGKPIFRVTTHRGDTFTHEDLSYGEKRLLAFMYHAAVNPEILVADELVNGMHYEWIDACLDAIQGQAFLTSQNPLLLDHLSFESAEEVQRRFVLCDRDESGNWIWRNMDADAADAFYRAYEVGLQHVGEILRTSGLW